jgi:hypothetical protein
MSVGRKLGGPKTGGRQKGTPNKRTQEREAAVQDAARKLETLIPNAFEGDSHAFLVSVYKDPAHPIERRLDAAKAAIPYERPRLSTTELNGTLGLRTHEDYVKEMQELGNRAAEAEALLAAEPQSQWAEPSKTHH